MNSKKLVFCCILGIVLGFLAPFVLKTDKHTSLMVGMVAGLGIGYLLDARDAKQADQEGQKSLGEKADRANKLMERARRGVDNEYLRMNYDDEEPEVSDSAEEEIPETAAGSDPLTPVTDYEAEAEEQAEKLSEAEDLLRAARERMKRGEDDSPSVEAPSDETAEDDAPAAAYDAETEEQAEKLNEAEELLRAARERMKKAH